MQLPSGLKKKSVSMVQIKRKDRLREKEKVLEKQPLKKLIKLTNQRLPWYKPAITNKRGLHYEEYYK